VVKRRTRPPLKKMIVVPVVIVIASAAFVGARAVAGKKTDAAAASERTVQATSGTMNQTVSTSGTLAPAATEDLNFSSSGKVTAVNVKAGQEVTKGQVLATIDSAALASSVVQAQAQVAADESTLASDESAGASAAQLSSDRANLASSEAQLASAQTALAGAALVAPISGTVTTVNLTVGQQLGSTGDSATALTGSRSGATIPPADNSSSASSSSASASTAQIEVISTTLVVNLSVDDTEVANLKAGQAATITASGTSSNTGPAGVFSAAGSATNPDANTVASTGTEAKVSSVGAIASASSGVATFPVVVKVTGSTSGLYAGATAQVSIVYKTLENVIQVPTLAVTQTNGQSFVTVSAAGKKTKRAVTTGITSGGQVQITSGLKAGEEVVVAIPSAVTPRGSNGNSGGTGNQPRGNFFGGPGLTPPNGKVPGQ
jgi:macrolide-specific efflux system membrane fusion protein